MTSSRKSLLMGFFRRTPMVTWLLLLSWAGKRRCSQFVGNSTGKTGKTLQFQAVRWHTFIYTGETVFLSSASLEGWARHLALSGVSLLPVSRRRKHKSIPAWIDHSLTVAVISDNFVLDFLMRSYSGGISWNIWSLDAVGSSTVA